MVLETNSFKMTYEGYLAYIHHYRFAKTWAYRLILYGTLAIMLILVLSLYINEDMEGFVGILGLTGLLFVWHVLMNYAFPAWGLWSLKRRGLHNHDCKVYIDEGHIWTIDAENEYRKPWQSIESAFATRKHIFIYFNKCHAFIIPKSAFNSVTEADVFFQTAKGYLTASRKPGK